MHVPDPNNSNKSIVKNDTKFDNYLERGYVYNEQDNSFIKPSKKTENRFDGEAQSYEFAIVNKNDPVVQMEKMKKRVTVLLERYLKEFNGCKFNFGFSVRFKKYEDGDVVEKISVPISAKSSKITHKSEARKALRIQKEDILRKIDRYTSQGSGWTISRIRNHFINIYRYKPLRGKSYIPLPKSIQNRKATINIKNKDNKCFIYCLGRNFDPNPQKDHLEKCNKHLKKVCVELGFDKIKTPVKITDIPKIEKQFGITINIYGHNDGEIYPIKTNDNIVDESKHIDLLLTSQENEDSISKHNVWIKNFDKLNFRQTKHEHKKHVCRNCLWGFSSKQVLEKHNPRCITLNGEQAVDYPTKG